MVRQSKSHRALVLRIGSLARRMVSAGSRVMKSSSHLLREDFIKRKLVGHECGRCILIAVLALSLGNRAELV